jgi:hypothetical protein
MPAVLQGPARLVGESLTMGGGGEVEGAFAHMEYRTGHGSGGGQIRRRTDQEEDRSGGGQGGTFWLSAHRRREPVMRKLMEAGWPGKAGLVGFGGQ